MEDEQEFFWTSVDLAKHLRFKNRRTIDQMIYEGKITRADGWFKLGKLNRFVKRVVIARCEAGQFAKGLDKDGRPVARSLRRVA
jgi:hypothetical protein